MPNIERDSIVGKFPIWLQAMIYLIVAAILLYVWWKWLNV
jgi:hypothetical protein